MTWENQKALHSAIHAVLSVDADAASRPSTG